MPKVLHISKKGTIEAVTVTHASEEYIFFKTMDGASFKLHKDSTSSKLFAANEYTNAEDILNFLLY